MFRNVRHHLHHTPYSRNCRFYSVAWFVVCEGCQGYFARCGFGCGAQGCESGLCWLFAGGGARATRTKSPALASGAWMRERSAILLLRCRRLIAFLDGSNGLMLPF